MRNDILKFIQSDLLNDKGTMDLLPEDDLLSTGLLDSIAIMRLIQYIEKSYEITISPEDMTIENFVSVKAIDTYLTAQKSV